MIARDVVREEKSIGKYFTLIYINSKNHFL